MSFQISKPFKIFLGISFLLAIIIFFFGFLGPNTFRYRFDQALEVAILFGLLYADYRLTKLWKVRYVVWSSVGFLLLYVFFFVFSLLTIHGEAAMGLAAMIWFAPFIIGGFILLQIIFYFISKHLNKNNFIN